jgi:two-component system chemotaxis sensor kinase CheA
VGERLCLIPSPHVERVARVAVPEIRTVENRETLVLDGDVVSLVGLGDVLEIPRRAADHAAIHAPVIVLHQNEARLAFRVDEILGEQEILLKVLGPQLARVRNVAGASVLGTGQVVPVLNVADLLKSAVNHVAPPLIPAAAEQTGTGTRKAVLVAEDSITSRALLKGILEAAGYAVTTAVDGMEAYATLKTAPFDLVVSDVEMPRMDGFDLTARVRADKHLAELPVVLVTALESREHRERGIDVGASAYIVKSSFDQSNLLEIIRRLI